MAHRADRAECRGSCSNSSLILNLNEPNVLGDVSWVEPGKYVGIWWAMHIKQATWESGPKHGATTAETRRYIDFAAANGFKGVLVEGWNVGWDGDWFHNGKLFKFTQSHPDFDLKAVTDYARSKGVRLVGHHETSGDVGNYEPQMPAAFDAVRVGRRAAGQDRLRGGRRRRAPHRRATASSCTNGTTGSSRSATTCACCARRRSTRSASTRTSP